MPGFLRILIACVALLAIETGAVALGQFAGGRLFALMQKLPPESVTVFTLYDYWQAFGDEPAVVRSLRVCTLLSVLLGCAPVTIVTIALLRSRGRIAQFGEARFATRREIQDAGLLEK